MIEIRVGKLARMLGVHRNTVSNWIKSGKFSARPTVGRRYLIERADFIHFCRNQGISEDITAQFANSGGFAKPRAHAAYPVARDTDRHTEKGGGMTDGPIGSVMVVGGGIAGMQATLDLADSGYKVFLVEKSAGIGGAMAQLDKTFPTNDCAM